MSVYDENKHAHSIGWNVWHLQWCTKYRYNVFKKNYLKNICVIAIEEAGKRHNIDVIDMEVDINHVHVVASLPMTMDAPKSLQFLKGFSSRLIFKLVPNLRKLYPKGHLWSPGKFATSIGHITVEKAKAYLEAHHAEASRWNLRPLGRERMSN